MIEIVICGLIVKIDRLSSHLAWKFHHLLYNYEQTMDYIIKNEKQNCFF